MEFINTTFNAEFGCKKDQDFHASIVYSDCKNICPFVIILETINATFFLQTRLYSNGTGRNYYFGAFFLDSETEKRLVAQAAHDPKAFSELFEEHYDSILRYCIYHTAQVEIARDITAETFFKALKNIWRFKFIGAPFSAWLYRIAGNEVSDYFRRKKYSHKLLTEMMERGELMPFESRSDLQDELEALQQKLEANRAYQKVRIAMKKMPMRYRDVLMLRFVEEKKISEICEILGKKEGTVKSLISRGLSSLRELSKKNMQPSKESIVYTDIFLKENL